MGFAPSRVWVMGQCGCMGYEVFFCEPTWWTEKPIGFKGVWGMQAMGYKRVNSMGEDPGACAFPVDSVD